MGEEAWRRHLEVENKGLMRIRKHNQMKVDAMLVSSPEHLDKGSDSRSISQLINIASMPGVEVKRGRWQIGTLVMVSQ